MSVGSVLAPVFVQVALTFALLFRLGAVRAAALRKGGVRKADALLNSKAWPALPVQVSNCLDNQFQMPVLFYLLVALELITHTADIFLVTLAWVFVVTRLVHAWVHTTTNRFEFRFSAYVAGVAVLIVAWALFAAKVLAGL